MPSLTTLCNLLCLNHSNNVHKMNIISFELTTTMIKSKTHAQT